MLDCLGPAVLTGKGCLLGVLDYLDLAAETGLGVCRTYWIYLGLIVLTGMGVRCVGLYGFSCGDKRGLLSVLDYLGPAAETGLGVCQAYWTVWVRPC